ncbi:MAG TPA: hypothetical protein VLI04_07260 [Nocardioidaceae bacterium]|nr:hypothetical protein [Nocardioidaceae bacterium]
MSELSPEEEAVISRLLADSASPVSMPSDVSARLDAVLADLVAERAEAEAAPVIAIRRRRWPQVLVAAAAVSLFGYVGANVMSQQSAETALDSSSVPGPASEEAPRGDIASQGGGGSEFRPPAPSPTDEAYLAESNQDALRSILAYGGVSDAIEGLSNSLTGAFVSRRPCFTPTSGTASETYNLRLSKSREAVVVVQRLNRSAARVYLYPCNQTIVPVSTTLLLGLR